MIVCWDASAVVKLVRDEPGRDLAARRAADLVATSRLRGADAVHLTTALDIADLGAEVVLATWDRRLHEAALHAGIGVTPAEL